jgi:hypothetical protein
MAKVLALRGKYGQRREPWKIQMRLFRPAQRPGDVNMPGDFAR